MSASELVNVNKNTAAYYFHQLRLLIYQTSPHLEMFEGEIEADESYFGGTRKGKRGRGVVEKSQYSGFSNEMARFILSLSLMRNQRHYCQLSERKLSLIAQCTRIPFVVMMCLMSVNLAIFASITACILLKIITT